MKRVAVIPSAGRGARMGGSGSAGRKNKNYLPIRGVPVIALTLKVFDSSPVIDSIVLVVPPGDVDFCRDEIVAEHGIGKVSHIVPGGSERQDSIRNGLAKVGHDAGIIVVHDGARCLVTGALIESAVRAAEEVGAAVTAVPVKDTIKTVRDGLVQRTLVREELRAVQTPQAFGAEILRRAYDEAYADGVLATDCAALVERLGAPVAVVPGAYENIKITTPEDLLLAERMLAAREA
jgi:2-C-methyl-D-erythritol 4-phosphate cytidylyltransferase